MLRHSTTQTLMSGAQLKRNFKLGPISSRGLLSKVPLIVTADRPPEWIDHDEGQL